MACFPGVLAQDARFQRLIPSHNMEGCLEKEKANGQTIARKDHAAADAVSAHRIFLADGMTTAKSSQSSIAP